MIETATPIPAAPFAIIPTPIPLAIFNDAISAANDTPREAANEIITDGSTSLIAFISNPNAAMTATKDRTNITVCPSFIPLPIFESAMASMANEPTTPIRPAIPFASMSQLSCPITIMIAASIPTTAERISKLAADFSEISMPEINFPNPANAAMTPAIPARPRRYSPTSLNTDVINFITPTSTAMANANEKKPRMLILTPPLKELIALIATTRTPITLINPSKPPTNSPNVKVFMSFMIPMRTPMATANEKNPLIFIFILPSPITFIA